MLLRERFFLKNSLILFEVILLIPEGDGIFNIYLNMNRTIIF